MGLRTRLLVVAAVLALAQSASVAVQAQFFWNWNQQDQHNRQRSRPQSGGLFDWFGGGLFQFATPRRRFLPSAAPAATTAKSTHATTAKRKLACTTAEKGGG
jgi:hypothetical protein